MGFGTEMVETLGINTEHRANKQSPRLSKCYKGVGHSNCAVNQSVMLN